MKQGMHDLALQKLSVPLSLYVHVPFCGKKCDYCDFYSVEGASPQNKRETVTRIFEDIDEFLDILRPPSIETLYVGGGTPNSMDRKIFSELLEGLRSRVGKSREWTVELNPEYLDTASLGSMRTVGVDRISLGVQSFHNGKLELIGRNARAEEAERALRLLQEQWSGRWSLDMISLLPTNGVGTQLSSAGRVEEWKQTAFEDLQRALTYEPRHLSLYGLTAEPGTPFFEKVKRGNAVLPEEGIAAELLREQWRLLEEHGFLHYEVSNFARDEQRMSLHNLRYWRLEPYLGVGPAAVSTLPGNDGPVRLSFPSDVESYCRARAHDRIHVEELSAFSFLLEHLMTGLRTREGVDRRRIAQRFGRQFAHTLFRTLEQKIQQYENSGFIERVHGATRRATRKGFLRHSASRTHGFRATDPGLMILDSLLLDLSGELERISPESVSWPKG